MKAPRFKGWFAKLPSLNQPQRRQVLDALHPAAGLAQVVALISEARSPGRCCPRCGNERCYRHGFANDLQRFRCCACDRTFNDLTGTPLARLRLKAKWLAYSQTLLDSLPVRKAANRVSVHRDTAFRWRHRFLHWVKLDRPQRLTALSRPTKHFCSNHKKVHARSIDHHVTAAAMLPNEAFPANWTASWSHAIARGARSMPSLVAVRSRLRNSNVNCYPGSIRRPCWSVTAIRRTAPLHASTGSRTRPSISAQGCV